MSSLIELHSDWLRPPHPTHLLVMFTLPTHTPLMSIRKKNRKAGNSQILSRCPPLKLWLTEWLSQTTCFVSPAPPLALNNLCQAEMRDRKVGRNWADELRYCGKFKTRVCWIFFIEILIDFLLKFTVQKLPEVPNNSVQSVQKCQNLPNVSKKIQKCSNCVKY